MRLYAECGEDMHERSSMAYPGIRRAGAADVPAVVELARELAGHEGEVEFDLTEDSLRAAMSGTPPMVSCHVAEADGEVVGMALWYPIFPTYAGKPAIYLESLFVRATQRGSGVGKALLASLAEECDLHGYAWLDWSVLNQNTSAIDFYRALGATAVDTQTRYRLTGAALRVLAQSPKSAIAAPCPHGLSTRSS
jgi:ribosomal protein S18 acetylase RimI-like enzyme